MVKNNTAKRPMERWEEALLEAAFTEILLEDCQALEASTPTDTEAELLRLAEEKLPERLAMLARSVRRPNPVAVLWQKSGAVLKYVAVLMIVATISLGAALAFNSDFRSKVIDFLYDLTEDYVGISITQDTSAPVRPEDWAAPYFPGYMPEGYVLEEYSSDTNLSWLDYSNEANQHIFVQISTCSLNSYLNNADAEYDVIHANGLDAITWISNGIHYVAMQKENHIVCVSATDISLCLAVAQSI